MSEGKEHVDLSEAEQDQEEGDESDWKELLIQEIQKFPTLWDTKRKDYKKNPEIKVTHWGLVSERLGKPVFDCKKVWHNLSDYYGKQLRAMKKPPKKRTGDPGGKSAKPKKSTWNFFDMMDFMRPVKETRKTSSNMKETVAVESLPEPESPPEVSEDDGGRSALQREIADYIASSSAAPNGPRRKSSEQTVAVTEGSVDALAPALISYMDKMGAHLDGKSGQNEIDKFGDFVTASIKMLQPRNQLDIQKQINDLLHDFKLKEMDYA